MGKIFYLRAILLGYFFNNIYSNNLEAINDNPIKSKVDIGIECYKSLNNKNYNLDIGSNKIITTKVLVYIACLVSLFALYYNAEKAKSIIGNGGIIGSKEKNIKKSFSLSTELVNRFNNNTKTPIENTEVHTIKKIKNKNQEENTNNGTIESDKISNDHLNSELEYDAVEVNNRIKTQNSRRKKYEDEEKAIEVVIGDNGEYIPLIEESDDTYDALCANVNNIKPIEHSPKKEVAIGGKYNSIPLIEESDDFVNEKMDIENNNNIITTINKKDNDKAINKVRADKGTKRYLSFLKPPKLLNFFVGFVVVTMLYINREYFYSKAEAESKNPLIIDNEIVGNNDSDIYNSSTTTPSSYPSVSPSINSSSSPSNNPSSSPSYNPSSSPTTPSEHPSLLPSITTSSNSNDAQSFNPSTPPLGKELSLVDEKCLELKYKDYNSCFEYLLAELNIESWVISTRVRQHDEYINNMNFKIEIDWAENFLSKWLTRLDKNSDLKNFFSNNLKPNVQALRNKYKRRNSLNELHKALGPLLKKSIEPLIRDIEKFKNKFDIFSDLSKKINIGKQQKEYMEKLNNELNNRKKEKQNLEARKEKIKPIEKPVEIEALRASILFSIQEIINIDGKIKLHTSDKNKERFIAERTAAFRDIEKNVAELRKKLYSEIGKGEQVKENQLELNALIKIEGKMNNLKIYYKKGIDHKEKI